MKYKVTAIWKTAEGRVIGTKEGWMSYEDSVAVHLWDTVEMGTNGRENHYTNPIFGKMTCHVESD